MIDPLAAIPATPEQQAAYAEQSTETLQETIARLAAMHPLEYEKMRCAVKNGVHRFKRQADWHSTAA